jgi:hypothetical protein
VKVVLQQVKGCLAVVDSRITATDASIRIIVVFCKLLAGQ